MCLRGRRVFVQVSLLAACSLVSEPGDEVGGGYTLVRFGVDPLPVKIFELPPGGCWYSITEGALLLDTRLDRPFEYTLIYRDSCDGDVLSTTHVVGTFTNAGSDLTFVTSSGTGTVSFPGRVRGDTVIVDRSVGFTYYFKKQ